MIGKAINLQRISGPPRPDQAYLEYDFFVQVRPGLKLLCRMKGVHEEEYKVRAKRERRFDIADAPAYWYGELFTRGTPGAPRGIVIGRAPEAEELFWLDYTMGHSLRSAHESENVREPEVRRIADAFAATVAHGALVKTEASSRYGGFTVWHAVNLLDLKRLVESGDVLSYLNIDGGDLDIIFAQGVDVMELAATGVGRALVDERLWEGTVMDFLARERGVISWAAERGALPKKLPPAALTLIGELINPFYQQFDVFESRSVSEILVLQDMMLQLGVESARIALPPKVAAKRVWMGRGAGGYDEHLLKQNPARQPRRTRAKKKQNRKLASILRNALK